MVQQNKSTESFVVRVIPVGVTPNMLSWFRVIAVPLIWVTYLLSPFGAFLVYFFACLSDLFDGMLARERGLISPNGKRLDAVADKVLVFGVLPVLFVDELILFDLNASMFWVLALVVTRDLIVSAMRLKWSARANVVPSLMTAKVKTVAFMSALGLLLYSGGDYIFSAYVSTAGYALLVVAVVFALVSMVQYIHLFSKNNLLVEES